MRYTNYLGTPGQVADLESRRVFARDLLLALKAKNINEGMQWFQAIHMHARSAAWKVTLPPQLGGAVLTVDLMNMFSSGDIETACLAMIYGEPDEMTAPQHWITPERKEWLVSQMKEFLGWP
jgi:hypothetical protein